MSGVRFLGFGRNGTAGDASMEKRAGAGAGVAAREAPHNAERARAGERRESAVDGVKANMVRGLDEQVVGGVDKGCVV